MTDQERIPRDIDRLVATLPETVRQALADLEGAPPRAVETTIGLLPFGPRALLEAVKVTRTAVLNATDDEGLQAGQRITLTHWGREVIAACADYQPSELDEAVQEERARELRGKLSPVRPLAD